MPSLPLPPTATDRAPADPSPQRCPVAGSAPATVRCGVVGVGHLGQWHADKYAKIAGATLVAVADPDLARAQQIADRCGCHATTAYQDLLGQVDAVSIAAPTSLHFAIARDFLAAGCHVLLEKPITATLEEATALNALADAHGLILQVGHLERFNPALRALLATPVHPLFIESHRLAPFKPRATDVSVVLDLMIHDIDIILSMVDAPLLEVRASGIQVLTEDIDIANARLEFANGCVANVTASRVSSKGERRMRIFLPDGYAVVDFQNHQLSCFRLPEEDGTAPAADATRILREERRFTDTDALYAEIVDFLAAIRGEKPVLVDGHAGQRALATAASITERVYANRTRIARSTHRSRRQGQ